jgi:tripartite-type tricarboxylate transporter receptor subunit TctC
VPYVRDGRLKALVVGGTSRLKVLPETPVFSETSVAPERADFMYSMVAPAGTPAAIKEKIAATTKKVLNDPKFREMNLDPYGYLAVASSPGEFERFLAKDRLAQAERIRISGVRPE